MRMIIVSAGVALILALLCTPLAIVVFSRRGYAQRAGEAGTATSAARRATPTMGGAVIVIASLIGYLAGHILTGDPATVSGSRVLGLMIGLGLAGLAGDVLTIRRQASWGLRGRARPAPWLDRFLATARSLRSPRTC
jgi:phospho-N-acetylmuramoyl-pentapeptide-transferase